MSQKEAVLKTTVAAVHAEKIAFIKKQTRIIDKLVIEQTLLQKKYDDCVTYPMKTDLEDELHELTEKIKRLKSETPNQHQYWAQAAPQIVKMCRKNKLIHHQLASHSQSTHRQTTSSLQRKPSIRPPVVRLRKTAKTKLRYNERDELKKFLAKTGTYVNKSMKTKKSHDIYCSDCETYRIEEDDQMVCPECGDSVSVLKESEHISYKDPPTNSTNYNYQPLSHFKDCLTYLQAKENTDVSHVVEALEKERTRRNYTSEQLTGQLIRRWLSKLGFNKYYEHIPLIMFKMNGEKPPVMTVETENKLCQMFCDIRESWDKHKSPTRKNMLSYPYIIHKFCELLGLNEWLPRLKMLECKTYLHSNDRVWRLICKDMGGREKGWRYISSF